MAGSMKRINGFCNLIGWTIDPVCVVVFLAGYVTERSSNDCFAKSVVLWVLYVVTRVNTYCCDGGIGWIPILVSVRVVLLYRVIIIINNYCMMVM